MHMMNLSGTQLSHSLAEDYPLHATRIHVHAQEAQPAIK